MQYIELTIGKTGDGAFIGTAEYKQKFITRTGESIADIEKLIRKHLRDHYRLVPSEIRFEVSYNLTSFFSHFDFINISMLAKRIGINAGLMRQYASGVKYPSEDKIQKICELIQGLGIELARVRICTSNRF